MALTFSAPDPCGGLDSTSGLSVGYVIVLDQLDHQSDMNGVFVCATRACLKEGKPAGRTGRAQQQFVKVTSIDGPRRAQTLGPYMVNWRASQQPQV